MGNHNDPKRGIVGDRRRVLTIHDGARLTPTLVQMLSVLAEASTEAAHLQTDSGDSLVSAPIGERVNADTWDLDRLDPVLVGRSDGVGIYVESRRII